MKRILSLIGALICITCIAKGQSFDLPRQEKGDFLMVSVHTSSANIGSEAKILITDGNEIIKSNDLNGFIKSSDVLTVTKWLNAVKDQGYKLAKTNGGGAGGQLRIGIMNYLFVKE